MADVLTPAQRRGNMVAIQSQDSRPKIIVGRLLHRFGYRYVLHDERLPGTPDLAFPARRKVISVGVGPHAVRKEPRER